MGQPRMEVVNPLGIKTFKKQKKEETAGLFWSTCELCRAHTSCRSDLDFDVGCDRALQEQLLWALGGARCAVLLHERWCFQTQVLDVAVAACSCHPSHPTTARFQGSVLPRDQLSHDYVRDQRDRLSLISLTSVPTVRQAATWIIEDIHMQICVMITPNNALCHPPESTESRVDSCFNPSWQSVICFPAQELCGGLGHLGGLSPRSPCWAANAELLSGEVSLSARLCKTRLLNLDRGACSQNRQRTPDLMQKRWLV